MEPFPERRFSLLSRVIGISNSNIQVENRLKSICDLLSREMGTDCVCVYRRDPRGDDLLPWISSCLQVEECTRFDFRIRPGEGVGGKAAQRRAPVFVPDVTEAPPHPAVPQELRDFRSILSVPVMDDVYLYGVMNYSHRARKEFDDGTVALLQVVATEVAGTIRNSNLYQDARKRVSELITLNDIGRAITSSFEVPDVLEYVAKTTLRLLQADGCTIRLAAREGGALQPVVDEGYTGAGLLREVRVHGNLLAREIAREKRPLLVNGPEDSPLFAALGRHGVRSFLGLPILSMGKILGTVSYYSCSPRVAFDMEGLHLVQTVCSQLANMLEHAAMFREARELARENQARARRFGVLYGVARDLMSTVRSERLLQIIIGVLTSSEGFNFGRAILFLLSEDGTSLVGRFGTGPGVVPPRRKRRRKEGAETGDVPPIDVQAIRVPLAGDGCLLARAVRERRPVRTETGCGAPPAAGGDPGTSFCRVHPPLFAVVPLVSKGEPRGAIYVDNAGGERPITDEDIQVLTMFASEAGLALENAFLYESLEAALGKVRAAQDRLVQTEKLAALGEMAAKIAHEIKNPLTVIGGFAARLTRPEGGRDPKRAARYGEIIRREVHRLERTIQQTLYFSREAAPAYRPVSINPVVREVLAMFREELDGAKVGTRARLDPATPVVAADPDQLKQILWNLVSNALHAMEGGGTLSVATRPAREGEGDGIVLEVGDTGGGIPHDVVHNIFNPFFTTKAEGTGLGLPIVHAIVQRHGGSIHLDNREGEGVTFSVFLPRVPKDAGAATRILEQMRRGTGNG